MRRVLVLALLFACRRTEPTMGAPSDPAQAPTIIDAAIADVAIKAAPKDAAPSGPGAVIDTPPWPDATTKLRLTWVMYPIDVSTGTPRGKIELVVRAGAVARRFSKIETATLSFVAQSQRACERHQSKSKLVASLYLNGGGNTTFEVTREGDDLVLTENGSSDGLCEPGPCPVTTVTLARFPIPPEVDSFEERFHVVEDSKHEHDETCPDY